MISKELLEKVLNRKIMTYHISGRKNSKIIHYSTGYNHHNQHTINIYELANRCKEWALSQKDSDDYLFRFNQFAINAEANIGKIKYFWCVLLMNNSRVSPEFKAETEPESIFKTCQWILENKNNSKTI